MVDAGDVFGELVRGALSVLWTVETPRDQRIAMVIANPMQWDVAGITTLLSAFDPFDLDPAIDIASPYEPAAQLILVSAPSALEWNRDAIEQSLWDGLAVVSPRRPQDRYRFDKLCSHLYESYRAARKHWRQQAESL